MRNLNLPVAAISASLMVVALTGGAAVAPNVPAPSCGDHVQVTRTGSSVRVVGTGLNAFIPAGKYGISYTYEDNGKEHGGYNASPTSGMNYPFTAYKKTAQTFTVYILNEAENLTYCSGNYRA